MSTRDDVVRYAASEPERMTPPRLSKITLPDLTIPPIQIPSIPRETLDAIAAISRSFHESIAIAINTIAPALASLKAYERQLLGFEDQARALGRCGWTLPLHLPIASIPDVLEGVEADSDYDGAFEDLYLANGGRAFHEMLNDLLASKELGPWRPLMAECAECYTEGKYRVAVPALFVVFEGALAQATNSLSRRGDAKTLSATRRQASKHGIDLLAWASLEGFTAELFRGHRFSDPEPRRVNRHWVLHGRSLAAWSRPDVLRLFQAIHTIL